MTPGTAFVRFTLDGREYTFDGEYPEALDERFVGLLDPAGIWQNRPDLSAQAAAPGDMLPDVLWEIAQLGGRVVEISGRRPDGSILWEDWRNPIVD